MLNDKEFQAYIGQMSDQYEAIKDVIYTNCHITDSHVQDMLGKLAAFRDTACTALRESHINKNFTDN